ncbi:hypothetical protein [Desulfitobacterium sp. AusDCA]|uniref:hypothetical protein n=1 Tax=Desulfitobacterium sp. AusDCA TaxID=3240383 RepID=UPI003DA6F03A
MTVFKSPSEKIIISEKIRLMRLKKSYQNELEKLPEGIIKIYSLGGQNLPYLVKEDSNQKQGKCLSHLSPRQMDELKNNLDRRKEVEFKLKRTIRWLNQIERVIDTGKIEEWVQEFKKRNELVE